VIPHATEQENLDVIPSRQAVCHMIAGRAYPRSGEGQYVPGCFLEPNLQATIPRVALLVNRRVARSDCRVQHSGLKIGHVAHRVHADVTVTGVSHI